MEHILDLLERPRLRGGDRQPALLPGHDPRVLRRSPEPTTTSPSCSAPPGACGRARSSSAARPFLVISGDALTDIDLGALAARHRHGRRDRHAGRQEGRRHARVRGRATRPRGQDHRLPGEAGRREEALSRSRQLRDLRVRARDLRLLPRAPASWTGPRTCSPTLLETDVPFYVHEIHEYWNDVGSLAELMQGTFDALARRAAAAARRRASCAPGVRSPPATRSCPRDAEVEGAAWIGRDVRIGSGVRLMGPVVLGRGSTVGDGAQLRASIVLPGTELADGSITIDAILGAPGHPREPAAAPRERGSASSERRLDESEALAALLARARTRPARARTARPARSPSRATARRP